jgi:hypothetical protein
MKSKPMTRSFHLVVAYSLLLLAVCSGTAHAQAPVPIKAEIITLSWDGSIKDLWYQGAKGPEKLDIYDSGFTMPMEYSGPPEIAFYKDKTALALPHEKRPPPTAVAKLPTTGGSVLLFFTTDTTDSNKWEVRILDNSLKNFPPGAYRFFNLTKTSIQIAIDKTFYPPIEPKHLSIVPSPTGEPIRDIALYIGIGKEIAYSSQWGHRDARRATVFVYPSERGEGRLEVRKFFQAVIPEEEAP